MNKETLIEITNKLYRLTLLFPKKEPLRYKMREIADKILDNALRIVYSLKNREFSSGVNPYQFGDKKTKDILSEVLEDLEILDGFFELAKNQNWVKLENILEIQTEYIKIKEGLKPTVERFEKIIQLPPAQVEAQSTLNRGIISDRKQKILEFLKEKGQAQVWEIKKIFPEVSKRTLRRDFKSLLKSGLIERIGERNDTFYRLKE